MKLYFFFFTLMCVRTARAQTKHDTMYITACSDTVSEYMYGIDGEELAYADFVQQKWVNALPSFTEQLKFVEGGYQQAVTDQEVCKSNLNIMLGKYQNDPVPQFFPHISIYSRSEVRLGEQNTLICHSARFFPPPIYVEWTKNGVNVTDSASFSQIYPNADYSYNQFSHLTITPQEGDIYTCTVKHSAQELPETRTWEVDVELPSMGSSIFCGVGLALGLLGVAVGTFFLIKGNQCN